MSDVFSRLFTESVASKTPKTAKIKEKHTQLDEETWMRRLASQCLLVDNSDKTNKTKNTKRIEKSSLDISTLHRKRPRQTRTQNRDSVLSNSSRRPVTVILSRDGSVRDTNNYVITDSIEPIQYQCLKPASIKHDPFNEHSLSLNLSSLSDSSRRRRRRTKTSRVDFRSSKTMFGPVLEASVGSSRRVEPLQNGVLPKSLPPVSATVRFWNSCGFPTSLSSISGVM